MGNASPEDDHKIIELSKLLPPEEFENNLNTLVTFEERVDTAVQALEKWTYVNGGNEHSTSLQDYITTTIDPQANIYNRINLTKAIINHYKNRDTLEQDGAEAFLQDVNHILVQGIEDGYGNPLQLYRDYKSTHELELGAGSKTVQELLTEVKEQISKNVQMSSLAPDNKPNLVLPGMSAQSGIMDNIGSYLTLEESNNYKKAEELQKALNHKNSQQPEASKSSSTEIHNPKIEHSTTKGSGGHSGP